MSKKWWLAIAGTFVLAIALAIAIAALLPPTPGVTYANFSRIEKGMTREQVEQLLGRPATRERINSFTWRAHERDIGGLGGNRDVWLSESDDHASAFFNQDGQVTDAVWNFWSDDRTTLEKLRDRLPWIAKPPPPSLLIEIK
jgi:hypothetical protein